MEMFLQTPVLTVFINQKPAPKRNVIIPSDNLLWRNRKICIKINDSVANNIGHLDSTMKNSISVILALRSLQ